MIVIALCSTAQNSSDNVPSAETSGMGVICLWLCCWPGCKHWCSVSNSAGSAALYSCASCIYTAVGACHRPNNGARQELWTSDHCQTNLYTVSDYITSHFCYLIDTSTVQPTYLHRCRSDKLCAIIHSMLINGNMQMSKLIGLSPATVKFLTSVAISVWDLFSSSMLTTLT